MKYLITGRDATASRAFIKTFERKSIDFIAPDEAKLDITKEEVVAEAVAGYIPDVIINCAAYNLVDQAEQEHEKAFAVNALGAKYLAQAAARHKAILVHFGSDYVFDGMKESGLYTEEDQVNPLNEYGKSKEPRPEGRGFLLGQSRRSAAWRSTVGSNRSSRRPCQPPWFNIEACLMGGPNFEGGRDTRKRMQHKQAQRKPMDHKSVQEFYNRQDAVHRDQHIRCPNAIHDLNKARRRVAGVIRGFGISNSQHPNVLDVGCGLGYYTKALSLIEADVTGLDFSQAAVDVSGATFPECRFVQGSLARRCRGKPRIRPDLDGQFFDDGHVRRHFHQRSAHRRSYASA